MEKPTSPEHSNPFGELTKMFEHLKIPGIDMHAIVESRRKDVDALVAANQATLESLQAMARKQTEVFAQAMQGVREAASLAKPDPTKYAELARKTYEKVVADMKEMAEMARKAQTEVMAGIGERATRSLQEIKSLVQEKK